MALKENLGNFTSRKFRGLLVIFKCENCKAGSFSVAFKITALTALGNIQAVPGPQCVFVVAPHLQSNPYQFPENHLILPVQSPAFPGYRFCRKAFITLLST